jgi:hypothetical protein
LIALAGQPDKDHVGDPLRDQDIGNTDNQIDDRAVENADERAHLGRRDVARNIGNVQVEIESECDQCAIDRARHAPQGEIEQVALPRPAQNPAQRVDDSAHERARTHENNLPGRHAGEDFDHRSTDVDDAEILREHDRRKQRPDQASHNETLVGVAAVNLAALLTLPRRTVSRHIAQCDQQEHYADPDEDQARAERVIHIREAGQPTTMAEQRMPPLARAKDDPLS